VVSRSDDAAHVGPMTVKILARTTEGIERIDALNLSCEGQVLMVEIQARIHNCNSDSRTGPVHSSRGSADTLDSARHDLRTRSVRRLQRLDQVGVTGHTCRIKRTESICICRLAL